jgi:hypothetical protein
MREFTLSSFAAFLTAELEHNTIEKAKEAALQMAAAAIAAEARRVLGTYDYQWPQLAPSTQAERVRAGYAANEPLLRRGELRDSIGFTIVKKGELAEIGSNDDVAVWQELGTTHIPPRSFLAGAAMHLEHDVVKACGKIVADAIRKAGHMNVEAEIWKIAIDVAKDLYKDAKETARDLTEEDHHR